MNKKLLRPHSDFMNELINICLKDLKWHQKLRLRVGMKLDDMWIWILTKTVYRKYK